MIDDDDKRPTHAGMIGDMYFDGEQTWHYCADIGWAVIDPPQPPKIVYR